MCWRIANLNKLDLERASSVMQDLNVLTPCKVVFTASGLSALSCLLFQHFLDVQLVGALQYSASLLHSHDTATRATMNMAVADGVIAAGQDGTCCVMKTQLSKQKGGGKAAANGERCILSSINDAASQPEP